MLSAMSTQRKTMGARLQKSAATLQNPDSDLKLCRDLQALAPKVTKTLGTDLANPLLQMTILNSAFATRDTKYRKAAVKNYKTILEKLD